MSCWSAARSPIPGAPSDGTRCGCSLPIGKAGCRAFSYDGNDPDGYRTMPEVIDFIAGYAKAISAPVRTHTTVTSVRSTETGYLVRTDQGDWRCRTVVLASGACNIARVPSFAARVPPSVATLTAQTYRNPGQLADGGVLVVGASSSGTQIAHELQRSGDRSRCRSESTSGRRASIAARTWNGGWMRPACSTSVTTRWMTSRGRDVFPRCNLPARRTARLWTSTR